MKREVVWILTIVALAAIFLPRVFQLDSFLTADEKRWQANVAGFVNKLSHGDVAHLVQQPHPGITTQWLAGPTVFSDSWQIRKLPLVLWQGILILLIGYVAWRLWTPWTAFFVTTSLAVSPQLVAHTRIYAMDSLLAQFCVLSVLLLVLWHKEKQSNYLVLAGASAAAAYLSKLPGIILVPFSLFFIVVWLRPNAKVISKHILIWLAGFIGASIIILPSWLFNPAGVLGDFMEFFRSDDYTALHQSGPWYYLDTLWFFSTPLEMIIVLCTVVGSIFLWKKINIQYRWQVVAMLLFAIGFVAMMSLGAKKGDRYILPAFVMIDVLVAPLFMAATDLLHTRKRRLQITAVLLVLLASQAWTLYRLQPYALAYVNPLTKPYFGNHHLGWGEGLDLAAKYLNAKPNPETIKVAAYYPTEFKYRFKGQVDSATHWEDDSIQYVVLYRAMYDRGPDAWETDVLHHFENVTPEKVITINNLPYVWIYKR